jgi:pilus assembly protein CpaC
VFEGSVYRWCGARLLVAPCVALIVAAAIVLAGGGISSAQERPVARFGGEEPAHRSYLRIPANAPLPVTRRITIGVDKSMLVELPIELENVLVSNPEVVNAVVKTQRQVYLLAKDQGEANVFFMGRDGSKVLLLEVVVARDLAALNDSLHRLLPGSKIKVETMGDNIVLTGSVMTPVDANRAAELAARAIKKKDSVVNMLTVVAEAKEQVLLKVTVAEMQRDAIRRLGIDVSAVANTGNFTFQKIITNAFPVTESLVPRGEAGSTGGIGWSSGSGSIGALIESLERTGLIRTLAEPNLTARRPNFSLVVNSRCRYQLTRIKSRSYSSRSALRRRSSRLC